MKNFVMFVLGVMMAISVAVIPMRGQTFNKSGRTALQFLKIGVGARQTAMGEAAIAYVRDVNSVFWNPAGLTGVAGGGQASFSYAKWFADLTYFSGAASVRWKDVGIFALSYMGLGYGNLAEALVSLPSGASDTRTGNTVTGGDIDIGFSYAREFTDQLSIGATVKYLHESLFTYGVHLFAYDIGTNYDVGYKGLRLAMSAQNFGPSVKFLNLSDREEGYDIPLFFRIGISSNLINRENGFFNVGPDNSLNISVDAIHTNDFGDRLHVGGEYWFQDLLALRAGYRFNYDEGNFSFGIGLNPKLAGMDIRLDYSYVKYTFLDSPHRLTLSVNY